MHVPIVIIGSGPAGLTAAIYAARAGCIPYVYVGSQPGGQLTTTTDVENFPGFAEGILGPKLMNEMNEQAKRVGAVIKHARITKAILQEGNHILHTDDPKEKVITTQTVIIATGATARTLSLVDEQKLMGHGVSTCATCDGFFYRNKEVAVVGGGDSAMEEALYLAELASKVWLIHRRDHFRASHIMLDRARKHKRIEFMVPWTVSQLLYSTEGQPSLTGINITHSDTQKTRKLTVDGLFYAIGHTPNTQLFETQLTTNEHGYLIVHEAVKTKITGVYAAGDVADPHFKQAITAAGMGCQAAMLATRYLQELS